MTCIITYEQQGSPEWFAHRVGIPGASSFDQIVTTKGAPSESRHKLMYQLAGERILGMKEDTYCNPAMLRGSALEPEARSVFEMLTEQEVTQCGFVYADERKLYGCSPDGLIGEHEGLEIKAPGLAKHIEYLSKGKIPSAYYQQIMGSLLVSEREKWHFMSYYPGVPPFITTAYRDEKFISMLEEAIEKFCSELISLYERLKK